VWPGGYELGRRVAASKIPGVKKPILRGNWSAVVPTAGKERTTVNYQQHFSAAGHSLLMEVIRGFLRNT
jgi:hypothetical protein